MLDHLFKPVGVAASFYTDDHFTCELLVETTDIIPLMVKLPAVNLAVTAIYITDGLLTRV